MRAAAGFHPDEACRQISEELSQRITLELLSGHRLAVTIHAMHLKNHFCQIDAYCRNVYSDAPLGLSGCHNTSTLAQLMLRRVGASMPLCARLTGIELGVKVSCR
jgi:hypothetical protein